MRAMAVAAMVATAVALPLDSSSPFPALPEDTSSAAWDALARRLEIDGQIGNSIDSSTLSIAERIVLSCLQAVAIYNAVELLFITLFTFKRWSGLYFWSMIVATLGVALNASAFVVNNNDLAPHRMIPAIMIILGWIPMVTGQALVLYSRLHLLCLDRRVLRLVLVMIIACAIVGHVPTAVMIIGSNIVPPPSTFLTLYSLYEKVEVTLFFAQEAVLSGIYLWKGRAFWRARGMSEKRAIRRLIQHLVVVNVLVVALDTTILALEYSGMYILQTSWKVFVYSVKLKCEISILNRLGDLVRAARTVEERDRVAADLEREWTETLRRAEQQFGQQLGKSNNPNNGQAGRGGREGEGQPWSPAELILDLDGVVDWRRPREGEASTSKEKEKEKAAAGGGNQASTSKKRSSTGLQVRENR